MSTREAHERMEQRRKEREAKEANLDRLLRNLGRGERSLDGEHLAVLWVACQLAMKHEEEFKALGGTFLWDVMVDLTTPALPAEAPADKVF